MLDWKKRQATRARVQVAIETEWTGSDLYDAEFLTQNSPRLRACLRGLSGRRQEHLRGSRLMTILTPPQFQSPGQRSMTCRC